MNIVALQENICSETLGFACLRFSLAYQLTAHWLRDPRAGFIFKFAKSMCATKDCYMVTWLNQTGFILWGIVRRKRLLNLSVVLKSISLQLAERFEIIEPIAKNKPNRRLDKNICMLRMQNGRLCQIKCITPFVTINNLAILFFNIQKQSIYSFWPEAVTNNHCF